MNVLCLGPQAKELIHILHSAGDKAVFFDAPLTAASEELHEVDFIVSFGYRHLIPYEALSLFPGRAVNLHISYLPWNRGADPNLWSFLEDTPKGTSIHYITEGLDTGDLLCQEEVVFDASETLKTSYDKLVLCELGLFESHWTEIKTGRLKAYPQKEGGSSHRKKDAEPYRYLLRKEWDTPVRELVGRAIQSKGRV